MVLPFILFLVLASTACNAFHCSSNAGFIPVKQRNCIRVLSPSTKIGIAKFKLRLQPSYHQRPLPKYSPTSIEATEGDDGGVQIEAAGDDSAKFSLSEQKLSAWIVFGLAVATVLGFLYEIWIDGNGLQLGDKYLKWMENLASGDSTLVITYMLGFFAVCHSGLASLRPKAEEIIGARAWRVIFALVSLPLAFSSIVYFINHRY